MAEPLTREREEQFISYFGPPRVFPLHRDHRPAARVLLTALKGVSVPLGLRLELEKLDPTLVREYPRIHAVLPSKSEPIVWSLCAPSNDPRRKVENYKLEVLPRQTKYLKERGIFAEIEALARSVHIRAGSRSAAAILSIGITPVITEHWAASIADVIVKITALVKPLYP